MSELLMEEFDTLNAGEISWESVDGLGISHETEFDVAEALSKPRFPKKMTANLSKLSTKMI